MVTPSTNGQNGGRGANGRFAAGNPGGPGNPFARESAKLRAAMLRSVTEDDIQKAIAALVAKAHAGNIPAIVALLDRFFGRPATHDLTERVEALEQLLEAKP